MVVSEEAFIERLQKAEVDRLARLAHAARVAVGAVEDPVRTILQEEAAGRVRLPAGPPRGRRCRRRGWGSGPVLQTPGRGLPRVGDVGIDEVRPGVPLDHPVPLGEQVLAGRGVGAVEAPVGSPSSDHRSLSRSIGSQKARGSAVWMSTGKPNRPHAAQIGSSRGSSTRISFPVESRWSSPRLLKTLSPQHHRLGPLQFGDGHLREARLVDLLEGQVAEEEQPVGLFGRHAPDELLDHRVELLAVPAREVDGPGDVLPVHRREHLRGVLLQAPVAMHVHRGEPGPLAEVFRGDQLLLGLVAPHLLVAEADCGAVRRVRFTGLGWRGLRDAGRGLGRCGLRVEGAARSTHRTATGGASSGRGRVGMDVRGPCGPERTPGRRSAGGERLISLNLEQRVKFNEWLAFVDRCPPGDAGVFPPQAGAAAASPQRLPSSPLRPTATELNRETTAPGGVARREQGGAGRLGDNGPVHADRGLVVEGGPGRVGDAGAGKGADAFGTVSHRQKQPGPRNRHGAGGGWNTTLPTLAASAIGSATTPPM